MTSVFIIFDIYDSNIVGTYTSLELAKKHAFIKYKNKGFWCIIENKLDDEPLNHLNIVYENDYDKLYKKIN
jgi:hypothetical protein